MPKQPIEVSLAPNRLRIEVADESVRANVKANDGYCPCMIYKTPDTKCMCKQFRDQKEPGPCHCGLYRKVWVDA